MNRGTIPGYYFDTQKRKYFRIQANHVAPTSAKYSKSNVNQEQRQERETKKLKRKERHILTQTVTRAKALKHPLLTGCGLQREIGDCPLASHIHDRDAAFVQNLEVADLDCNMDGYDTIGITDVLRLSNGQTVRAISHGQHSHSVYIHDSDDVLGGSHSWPWEQSPVAFTRRVVSIEAATISSDEYVMACANYASAAEYCLIRADGSDPVFPLTQLRDIQTLWASAVNPWQPMAAFTGTGAVLTKGLEERYTHLWNVPLQDHMESLALDWLSPNVLAYGLTQELSRRTFKHHAYLGDLRIDPSDGVPCASARIKRPSRVTGMKRIDGSGHNLIVTSNREIDLYDLRMTSTSKPPLLSIKHTSPGARLLFDIRQNLVAAADEFNAVNIYSLQTGKQLRKFEAHKFWTGQGHLRTQSLRWQENSKGSPYLQACFGNSVVRNWSWNARL